MKNTIWESLYKTQHRLINSSYTCYKRWIHYIINNQLQVDASQTHHVFERPVISIFFEFVPWELKTDEILTNNFLPGRWIFKKSWFWSKKIGAKNDPKKHASQTHQHMKPIIRNVTNFWLIKLCVQWTLSYISCPLLFCYRWRTLWMTFF